MDISGKRPSGEKSKGEKSTFKIFLTVLVGKDYNEKDGCKLIRMKEGIAHEDFYKGKICITSYVRFGTE